MSTIITRDGVKVAGPFDSEDAAFGALLRLQPMSCDWAMKYEGYDIVDDEDPLPPVAVIDMDTATDPGEQYTVVARFSSEHQAEAWIDQHGDKAKVDRGGYGIDAPEPCCIVDMQTRGRLHHVTCENY